MCCPSAYTLVFRAKTAAMKQLSGAPHHPQTSSNGWLSEKTIVNGNTPSSCVLYVCSAAPDYDQQQQQQQQQEGQIRYTQVVWAGKAKQAWRAKIVCRASHQDGDAPFGASPIGRFPRTGGWVLGSSAYIYLPTQQE